MCLSRRDVGALGEELQAGAPRASLVAGLETNSLAKSVNVEGHDRTREGRSLLVVVQLLIRGGVLERELSFVLCYVLRRCIPSCELDLGGRSAALDTA